MFYFFRFITLQTCIYLIDLLPNCESKFEILNRHIFSVEYILLVTYIFLVNLLSIWLKYSVTFCILNIKP